MRRWKGGGGAGSARLETDGRITPIAEGLHPPTGFAFAPDGRGLYCADWPRGTVTFFSYDRESGAIADPRPFTVFPGSLGTPAGLAVDVKGFLWAGARGGSCALRFSAEGREAQRLYFAATLVTGLALAGEDGRDLWVTTAGGDDKAANGAGAGALYRFRAGVRGQAVLLSRITIGRE